MTEKEKAKELIERFGEALIHESWTIEMWDGITEDARRRIKLFAIICADELYLLIQKSTPKDYPYANLMSLEYWEEVKREINAKT